MEISRQLAIQKVWDSPDVVPEVVEALQAMPDTVWDAAPDLGELREAARPFCEAAGCDVEELEQILSRHVGDTWWRPR